MIFYWLRKAWLRVVWLFTPPTARQVARIDKDAPCPACGATNGELLCVWKPGVVENKPEAVLVRHTCHACGARWHEKPVTDATVEHVWSADHKLATLSRSGSAA